MSNSSLAVLGSKIRHAMTQWLLPLYKWVGVAHPKVSLVVMFLIGGLIFGGMWYLTGREYREQHPESAFHPGTVKLVPPPAGWLPAWGQSLPHNILRSVVDVTSIIPYRTHFHLMLVYRVADDTVDEQEDTRIIKSGLFSITENPKLVMDTPLSQEFLDNVT